MRHLSLILIAMAALLLGACQTDDATPSVSEEPLFPSASAGASASAAASTDASADASASESADSSSSPDSSASPDDSDDASASPDDSDDASDDASASPDSSDDGSGTSGGDDSCDAAFADVPELTSVDSLTALQDIFTAIDSTIEACDSADQWTELASDNLALVDSPEDAEEFLRARCEDSQAVADSDICEEL